MEGQFPALAGFAVALEYAGRVATPGTGEFAGLMAVPVGESRRVELGEGVYALEEAYQTKADSEVRWEAHRKFIDLQLVVTGKEVMEVTDLGRLTLEEDFSPERDLQYFRGNDGGSRIRVGAGEAAVFFPDDAHRPGLADGLPCLVRKVVVKIPAER